MAVALIFSTAFIFLLNTRINSRNYEEIVCSTLNDIEKDIANTSDINMLEQTIRIKGKVLSVLDRNPAEDVSAIDDELRTIVKEEGLSEMSVVNADNVVI